MKQRLHFIDNLKGFLILLVVLGHCIQNTDAEFDQNIVFRYIYSFHMPLFMCISGFVSYRPMTEWRTVGKRFVQLIIPFFAWAVLGCCIRQNFDGFSDKILHPDTGLWFLWALFFIVLILKLCEDTANRIKIAPEYVAITAGLIMIGIMVVLKFKLFGFQFIAWYFIFYCMGYYGRKYEEKFGHLGKPAALVLLTLFLTAAYYWMRKDPPTFMPVESSVIYNYAYKFIVATIACITFISLFKSYANYKALIISELGGVTLGIYAIHQSVISVFLPLTENVSTTRSTYIFAIFVLWLVSTAISYLVYQLLKRNRYTSLLFLGKYSAKIKCVTDFDVCVHGK